MTGICIMDSDVQPRDELYDVITKKKINASVKKIEISHIALL